MIIGGAAFGSDDGYTMWESGVGVCIIRIGPVRVKRDSIWIPTRLGKGGRKLVFVSI